MLAINYIKLKNAYEATCKKLINKKRVIDGFKPIQEYSKTLKEFLRFIKIE